ncbi:hypothetical protein ASA01S_131_00060 [Aeromonas salmonicida subsp. masoucida NBRC 13784]|nr:hypothetical protein ASA01S_131_00060 [Aeromonas salmonicida subsp. masoucida NBRC 13784]
MCMEMVFTRQLTTKESGHTASNRITQRYPYHVIWSHRITTNEKVARRKLSLLEPAKELNIVV